MAIKLEEPNFYSIVLADNDKLTISFVKEVLLSIFHQEQSLCEANIIDLKRSGHIEVGRLPLQFAEQKQAEVDFLSKAEGIPFKCQIHQVKQD